MIEIRMKLCIFAITKPQKMRKANRLPYVFSYSSYKENSRYVSLELIYRIY